MHDTWLTRILVDPLGVLKEDEIFYKASESFMDPVAQTLVSVVEGEVIVSLLNFSLLREDLTCVIR